MLKFFDADPGSGMEKVGSGPNIPDPQHWWLERLTVNNEVATGLGSIPASSDTVESEGRQMNQCGIQYKEEKKIPPFNS
jgi:hypothetical protein